MISDLKQLKQKVRNLINGDYTGYYVADVTPEKWLQYINELKDEQAKSLKAKREEQDIEYQKKLKSNFEKIMEDMNDPKFFETLRSGGNGKDQLEGINGYERDNSTTYSSQVVVHANNAIENVLQEIMKYANVNSFEQYAQPEYLNLWINLTVLSVEQLSTKIISVCFLRLGE